MLRWILSCCLITIVWGRGIIEVKDHSANGRIIGGTTAQKDQFPYQVSLRSGIWQSHFCGGFIITVRWIGTAAHCTYGRTAAGVIAVVGAVSRTSEGSIHRMYKIVDHPDYDNSNLRNDISLMKTESRIEFTSTVQPIHLGAYYANNGTSATVSGWGYTTNPGYVASNLQWIKVKVVDNEDCKHRMTASNAVKIFDSSLCAQSDASGGACMGDSGGPLVGPNNVLIAISSWGVPCSQGYPDVYTRVSSFHDWIDSVLDF